MTPREIFDLPVLRQGGIHDMLNCNEWPLIPEEAGWTRPLDIDGLVVNIHGRVWLDHRRDWIVFSVLYEGKPVAVGRAAGRERNDHYDHLIVDRDQYRKLATAIRMAIPIKDEVQITEMDANIGDWLAWYGRRVDPGVEKYSEDYYR